MEGILEHNEPMPDVGECSWQDNQDWTFDHWQNTPDSPRAPLLSPLYLIPCEKENATKRHRRVGRDSSPRLRFVCLDPEQEQHLPVGTYRNCILGRHSGRCTGLFPGRLGTVNENLGTKILIRFQRPRPRPTPLFHYSQPHGSRGHTPHRFDLQSQPARSVVVAGTGVHLQRTVRT